MRAHQWNVECWELSIHYNAFLYYHSLTMAIEFALSQLLCSALSEWETFSSPFVHFIDYFVFGLSYLREVFWVFIKNHYKSAAYKIKTTTLNGREFHLKLLQNFKSSLNWNTKELIFQSWSSYNVIKLRIATHPKLICTHFYIQYHLESYEVILKK